MESKIRGILPSLLKDILPSLLPSTESGKLPEHDLITSEQLESRWGLSRTANGDQEPDSPIHVDSISDRDSTGKVASLEGHYWKP
jgi:hypothetical protein